MVSLQRRRVCFSTSHPLGSASLRSLLRFAAPTARHKTTLDGICTHDPGRSDAGPGRIICYVRSSRVRMCGARVLRLRVRQAPAALHVRRGYELILSSACPHTDSCRNSPAISRPVHPRASPQEKVKESNDSGIRLNRWIGTSVCHGSAFDSAPMPTTY